MLNRSETTILFSGKESKRDICLELRNIKYRPKTNNANNELDNYAARELCEKLIEILLFENKSNFMRRDFAITNKDVNKLWIPIEHKMMIKSILNLKSNFLQ